MSDDAELPRDTPRTLVDPVPTDYTLEVATALPRVRWGRAAMLQIVAGGIAGFTVPFWYSDLPSGTWLGRTDPASQAFWIGIFIVSAVLVALFGAGIPLLVAWLSWRRVARSRRGLRREALAVVLGAIGGSLIASVLPFFYMAGVEAPWAFYPSTVFALGGIPGVAFALWVAAAWHGVRDSAAIAS